MSFIVWAIAISLTANPLPAQDKPAQSSPTVIDNLIACRAVEDAAARLACLDRGIRELERARADGDITVMDRAAVRSAKRSLFGYTLPSAELLGRGADKEPEVREITSTVTAVRSFGHGIYAITLGNGATWSFTEELGEAPRKGETVTIKRGALGSYKASLRANTSFTRIKREN